MRTQQRGYAALRWFFELAGVYIMGLGTACLVKSSTGTSPLVSISYVMSLLIPSVSMGTFSFLLNLMFFLGQLLLQGRKFSWSNVLQLLPTALLSLSIDWNNWLLADFLPGSYLIRLLILGTGCLLYGVSIAMMVSARILLMPMDTFISLLAERVGTSWGNIKTVLDVTLVVLASVLSLLGLGYLAGVREGTLISALCVGQLTRLFSLFTERMVGIRRPTGETGWTEKP